MKIKLITADHTKKIQTIKLIRQLTGMNLANAKKTVENTPSEFIVELPYEETFDIESKFNKLDAIVIIQTGALEKKESTKKRITSLEGALFYNEHEIEEKATLNNKEEIVEYLIRNQNLDKAKVAAFTSSVIMAITLTFYKFSIGFYSLWLLPLAGVMIGFAVKRAGKGVESKFGIIAGVYTFATIIAVNILLAASYIVLENFQLRGFFSMAYPGTYTILVGIISSGIAYKIAFKQVISSDSSLHKSQTISSKSASYRIEQAKENATGSDSLRKAKKENQQRDSRYNWKKNERPSAGKPKLK